MGRNKVSDSKCRVDFNYARLYFSWCRTLYLALNSLLIFLSIALSFLPYLDCVSPRCLKDGSFPFFRWLENEQRRLVSPKSLCNFILHWGKGELELEEYKEIWMRE